MVLAPDSDRPYLEAMDLAHLSAHPGRLTAMWRGFQQRCPRCGEGHLYRALLKFVDHCPACGEALGEIRADDIPAWLTILVAGHLVLPLILIAARTDLPGWIDTTGGIAMLLALVAVLLPRFKGATAGLLWSLGMPGGTPN